jgi:hypothetical protein
MGCDSIPCALAIEANGVVRLVTIAAVMRQEVHTMQVGAALLRWWTRKPKRAALAADIWRRNARTQRGPSMKT